LLRALIAAAAYKIIGLKRCSFSATQKYINKTIWSLDLLFNLAKLQFICQVLFVVESDLSAPPKKKKSKQTKVTNK
jgi:hypothetical protein